MALNGKVLKHKMEMCRFGCPHSQDTDLETKIAEVCIHTRRNVCRSDCPHSQETEAQLAVRVLVLGSK